MWDYFPQVGMTVTN